MDAYTCDSKTCANAIEQELDTGPAYREGYTADQPKWNAYWNTNDPVTT